MVANAVRARCFGHYSSANSANSKKMTFPGAVEGKKFGIRIFASVFGLTVGENTALSVALLAHVFNISPKDMINHIIEKGGKLDRNILLNRGYLGEFFLRIGPTLRR